MPSLPSHDASDDRIRQWLTEVTHHDEQPTTQGRSINPIERSNPHAAKRQKSDRQHDDRAHLKEHESKAAYLEPTVGQTRAVEHELNTLKPPSNVDKAANYNADDAHTDDLQQKAAIASEKYARRKRHKTRAERYEYHPKHSTADTKRESRAREKRKSHRKSGSVLNRNFKAPNVGNERLTLKQEAMPGIFSKGKASEPTERRGIPDLTFSEMSFLNKRRSLENAKLRGQQAMSKSSNKKKGGAEDVSGYFSRQSLDVAEKDAISDEQPAQIPPGNMVSPRGQQPQTLIVRRYGDTAAPQSALMGHKDFGSIAGRGAASTYDFRDCGRRSEQNGRFPTEPSSYVSWSTSPAREAAMPIHRPSALQHLPEVIRPGIGYPQSPELVSVNVESSVSQRDQRAENVRSQLNQESGLVWHLPACPPAKQYFTLEDLLELAQERPVTDQSPPAHGLRRNVRYEHDPGSPPIQELSCMHGNHRPATVPATLPPLWSGPDPNMMPYNGVQPGPDLSEDHSVYQEGENISHSLHTNRRGLVSESEIRELEAFNGSPDSEGQLDNFDRDILETTNCQKDRINAQIPMSITYTGNHQQLPSCYNQILPDVYTLVTEQPATPEVHESEQQRASDNRPQLLRPSCEDQDGLLPFSGFSRPRMLY